MVNDVGLRGCPHWKSSLGKVAARRVPGGYIGSGIGYRSRRTKCDQPQIAPTPLAAGGGTIQCKT